MNFLLTWNCAHLKNAEIWLAVYSLYKLRGYECPIICTPEELMGEDYMLKDPIVEEILKFVKQMPKNLTMI